MGGLRDMRVRRLLPIGAALSALGLAAAGLSALAQPIAGKVATPVGTPADAEPADVAVLPPTNPRRVFLLDSFGGQEARVLDGESGKLLGGVSAAPLSNIAFSPDQSRVYVAESIWTKGNRGDRQDMVSVYDGASLELLEEIPIPGRVYMGSRKQNFAVSGDGATGYVYNMDPSSSVIVVDLAARKVAQTVETPGCAMVFPFGAKGFSAVCGNGALATVTLEGATPKLTMGKSFFDAENDPVFENSPTDAATGKALFITYTGQVWPAQLAATPVFEKPWSLQAAAGFAAPKADDRELAWRPGGNQPATIHKATNRLYILMHAGGHWTHKKAGDEVWIYDLGQRKLIKRFKLEEKLDSISVSQDADPVLFGSTRGGLFTVLNATTGEVVRTVKGVGGLVFDPAG